MPSRLTLHRMATVTMALPVVLAAVLAWAAEPKRAVPVEYVQALTEAEIAELVEAAATPGADPTTLVAEAGQ